MTYQDMQTCLDADQRGIVLNFVVPEAIMAGRYTIGDAQNLYFAEELWEKRGTNPIEARADLEELERDNFFDR